MKAIRCKTSASGLLSARHVKKLAIIIATLITSSSIATASYADECNPTGQTACPTENCFFWVSGIGPGTSPYPPGPNDRIGNTTEWEVGWYSTFLGVYSGGSNLVGPGDYPDSYAGGTGPFAKAANGSFDGIAIGANTRIQIFSEPNFGGTLLLDISGPRVISNCVMSKAAGVSGWPSNCSSWLGEDWSSQGSLFTQFTPASRSNSGVNMWSYGGGPGQPLNCTPSAFFTTCDPNLSFVPTSIKVSCTSPLSGSCLPVASCPPATVSVNGTCGGAGTCSTGTVTNDGGQTACGTTRTWDCAGSGGGTTASCSVANPACSSVVNGACSGTPGVCSSGSISGDNGLTACGTTRVWDCTGSGGGTNDGCSFVNPACPTTGCGTAAGVSVSSAPSSNLCSSGTASGVTQNGSLWEWTCTP